MTAITWSWVHRRLGAIRSTLAPVGDDSILWPPSVSLRGAEDLTPEITGRRTWNRAIVHAWSVTERLFGSRVRIERGHRRASETLDGAIDCRIRMVASRSDPKNPARIQRDGHRARDAFTTLPLLCRSQDDACVSDLLGVDELRQGGEQAVFRVRASLRADSVFCQYLNAH